MAVPLAIPAVIGVLAVFSTAAVIALEAVLAQQLQTSTATSTRGVAITASILEAAMLVVFCLLSIDHFRSRTRPATEGFITEKQPPEAQSSRGLQLGLSSLLCAVSTAVSVAALARLGTNTTGLPPTMLGSQVVPFLAGSAVTLGVCFVAQLLFLITLFIGARLPAAPYDSATSARPSDSERHGGHRTRSPPAGRVKGIRYSQTLAPAPARSPTGGAILTGDPHSSAGSSDSRSVTETMSSLRSSLSGAVRPISSRTRLLPATSMSSLQSLRRSTSRPNSLSPPTSTYMAGHDSQASAEEDFDSWDTSAVSPQNRRAVLESAVSSLVAGGSNHLLETIPASPSTSRSPSPGTPLDLPPPSNSKTRRRSRSYSSTSGTVSPVSDPVMAGRARAQSHSPPNEAHIHPLFRSDSPTPAPAVSAGTVVTAAPNAGHVLTADVQSLRTLHRMRSGSLPVVPSPLSRQGSFDDFGAARRALMGSSACTSTADRERPLTGRSMRLCEAREEEEEDEDVDMDGHDEGLTASRVTERKMTPPIPEWILSAGARSSLSGYESRKVRIEDGAI